MNFKKKTKSQDLEKIQETKDVLENLYALFEGRERVLDAFESKIFQIKTKGSSYLDFKHSNLKILTPKQMLQVWSIAIAIEKQAIIQKVYGMRSGRLFALCINQKKITKNVYNNVIKSIKV